MEPILRLEGITKRFPGIKALDSVDLDIYPGEIHVLAGENGAGKSTLMKVLSGVYQPDEGKLFFEGKETAISTPEVAEKLGIRMIYQELNLIPELSVASNIFLGHELYKWGPLGILDSAKMEKQAGEILERLHIDIDPAAKVKSLGVGQQQMIEIAKALSMEARLVVFDEPTSSLMDKEIQELFSLIRHLKEKGIAMFYISHRLEELFEIGERVTILRDGMKIDTKKISEITMEELIEKIANRPLNNLYPHVKKEPGKVLLEVKGLTNEKCRDISIKVREGEIVGLAGLVGAGRTELARAIFGIDDYGKGEVLLEGQKVPRHNAGKAAAMGLSLLPEDRKSEGLALKLSIRENMTIASLKRMFPRFFTFGKKEKRETEKYVEQLAIATSSVEKAAGQLSGGTQQKVVVSKWLLTKGKVFIFDEPTRGIDVGAKTSIYSIMDELVENGGAILMISSDLSEVLGMSDRIYVMAGGAVEGELSAEEATQTEILKYAFSQG